MKITVTLLILLTAFSPNIFAQGSPQWHLPEDARARLGKGYIDGIQYSPDGTRLAVASSIGIWIYDAQTGEELNLLTEHRNSVITVSFSPDGRTLASGSWDDTIRLWNADTGQLKNTLTGHTRWVNGVSFSPDGRTLASGSADNTIRLWDAETGAHLKTLRGHTGYIRSVSFSPDGLMLASGSVDSTVRLWDGVTGTHLRTLTGHTVHVNSVSFSPDGGTLASGGSDGTIRLWDADTGQLKNTFDGHERGIKRLTFSSDGRTLASGGWDSAVHLWDVVTGTDNKTLTGHTGYIWSVSFSPDGRTLASGSRDGTIRLWDVVTGAHKKTFAGHMGQVFSLAFSRDGRTLASGAIGGIAIHLWDVVTGTHKNSLIGHTESVFSLAFSSDGSMLAGGDNHATIRLWDGVTGAHLRTLTGHRGTINSVSFSPDGRTLASGSLDDTVRLWNTATGEHLKTFTGHRESVDSVSFSPDGGTLASGGRDDTIRLWDVDTGEHKGVLTGHTDWVLSVSFSPDGGTLVSGGRDDTIRLWDAATGIHRNRLIGHTSGVTCLAFSPDGGTLASGSWDDTIRLWDITTNTHLETLTDENIGSVYSLAFSPDGGTLASGTSNGTIFLWDFDPVTFATLNFSPFPIQSPAIGALLTLSLDIANGEDVAGYQTTVRFDTSTLRYVESAKGDYLPAGAFFVPPIVSGDTVTLGATSFGGVSSGNGTLATLIFEVLDVKASTLSLSDVILTDSEGEHLRVLAKPGRIIEPMARPSSAVVSVTPSSVLSPAIGERLVFNVDIAGLAFDQSVTDFQLTWEYDGTALRYISRSQGDYLSAGNRDSTLVTATFEVLEIKASTLSFSGYFIAANGFRYIPTFRSAKVIVPLLGDVNRDGVVNILDLVLVASKFGQRVSGDSADINEDGVINIVDLVKVAGVIGGGAAAPSAWHLSPEVIPTRADVEQWLSEAQHLNLTDPTSQRGVIFLEQLLAALTPKETVLLPNYPNPFNPETWIPYQLAKPADVTLTIYAADGVVVRKLALGHQPVGIYQGKSRAVYWDGRNELGEPVASGVYFYTLTAGDFTTTRKMLIRK